MKSSGGVATPRKSYRVVTQYVLDETRATSGGRNAERAVEAVNKTVRAGQRTFRQLGESGEAAGRRVENAMTRGERAAQRYGAALPLLNRYIGPLAIAGGVFEAARRTFAGLNEEAERSLQLGSSFNLAFRFDADPARQFTSSMLASRKLVAGIVEDAARLPGSSRDFFSIAAITTGPIFRAGGTPEDVRRMLGNIAIVAPSVGQSAGDAGAGAMRTLTGQAGADIPLLQKLMSAGLLPLADKYNAQTAAQRFEQLDRALERLVGNPFFRKEVDQLMATQLGTLEDSCAERFASQEELTAPHGGIYGSSEGKGSTGTAYAAAEPRASHRDRSGRDDDRTAARRGYLRSRGSSRVDARVQRASQRCEQDRLVPRARMLVVPWKFAGSL